MNPVHDHDAPFDAQARRLHAAALSHVSPQTLARLRAARHAATQDAPAARAGHWRWMAATAFTAVLAVGVGVQFLPDRQAAPPSATPPAMADAAAGSADDFNAASVYDEDPDLYLWLASVDAQPLAMESTP